MKGIILAGGQATRLYPITQAVCKQLLPIYDKPMIYYPLSVLLLAGIRDILIITTQEALPGLTKLFGAGEELGFSLSYAVQDKPRGIAEAFIIGEEFIGDDAVCLILGDNLFFGQGLSELLHECVQELNGATVFCYKVKDPERYGVVTFDASMNALSIDEKPKTPRSHWAVTGLYFYDNEVVRLAKTVKPSRRGELEITDINTLYLKNHRIKVTLLGRGYAWLDTGTYDTLLDASLFIKAVEERQGLKIGCVEEIAYNLGYMSEQQMLNRAQVINTSYGMYLSRIVHEHKRL